ncbi:ribosome small subunit-dependent GTPase A [Deinococcus peraridilitoris]|uniref:Small ribosomal subunit biogenesis GTPase RsgA n=1 Tax=Deinococcus peraridilitoris (strain DSM 19664 / LMG 22246 / CIP 109416 / KR-200) TaxID=937777 RepID=L0A2V8_DEIPD|nr:ribosome small subunit-dependent GTPase A [Deinococcus peraridilitoris]AFZ68218.1 ribosome small subunit-dependent GTPase A [Deinococcus peraridilitoris DSM 19664]
MHEHLLALGWNDFFEDHFRALNAFGVEPARVASVQKASFRVVTKGGVTSAVPSGLLLHPDAPRSEYPAIGDWVAVRQQEADDTVVVTHVLPRRTRFSRALGAGNPRRPEAVVEQVIATNIDFVFIVTSLDEDFSVRRIERYVAAVTGSGARPVLVLNKADLRGDVDTLRAEVATVAPDVPLHTVSALQSEELGELRGYFTPGTTVALIGSSGVGKSTLTNRLLGHEAAATGAVREWDSKGRHTTTSRELYLLPGGGVLIDNPGLREIAVWAEEVEDTFSDIEALALQCQYRGCTHSGEIGCAVQAAVQEGRLNAGRLENYQRLQAEAGAPRARTKSRKGKRR